MSIIVNEISIDLMKPGEMPVVYAVQGECNTRSVKLCLFCDGEPWKIPEGTLPAIRYGRVTQTGGYYDTLPDGTCAWTYEGNVITIILAPQMMSSAGAVFAQVEMIMGDRLLATFSFKLLVAGNPAPGVSTPETYVNWLQWMKDQLKEQVQSMQESGAFTGPAGPQGDPAEVTGYDVVYQAGISPGAIPEGDWSSTIPNVPAGQYLWTKTTIMFNDCSPVTFYSVSRMGIDGLGSVVSVCSISPDENGNVVLDAAAVGALPLAGGSMEGPVNMNGKTLSGLNEPAEDTEAVPKSYVDTAVRKALPIAGGTMEGPVNMNGQSLSGLNVPTEDTEAATRGYTLVLVKKAAPRNWLDNSDFTNFVAQAGIGGSHGTQAYAGDRWILESGTVTGEANADGNGYSNITLTGTIRQIAAVPPDVGTVEIEMLSGTAAITYENGEVTITSEGGIIKNAALYKGEYTEETLPEYQPKGYAAELAECQRYFRKCVNGNGYVSTQNAYIFIPATMRITPAVTVHSPGSIRTQGLSVEPASVSAVYMYDDSIRLTMPGTFTASNYSGSLFNADIDLSADL